MEEKNLLSIIGALLSIIGIIIALFGNSLFLVSCILLISSVFLGFIIYKRFFPSKIIPLLILFVLVFVGGLGMLTNEVIGVSYLIQIDHDGEYTAGFGSEYLTREGFTENKFNEFDLGDTSHIDVGAKKSTDNHKAIKLKIFKKRMINLFGYEKIAENVTSEPYGEVFLNI